MGAEFQSEKMKTVLEVDGEISGNVLNTLTCTLKNG